MTCKIDHTDPACIPKFACRVCTPRQLGHPPWTTSQAPQEEALDPRRQGRHDLPQTMDETAWAILAHIEGKKERAKQLALEALKLSQDALKAEIGVDAYNARQSIRRASKRAAEHVSNVAPSRRTHATRKRGATQKSHKASKRRVRQS